MAAYIVVHIDIHDPVRYETYRAMAPASIRQYGGRYLTRGGAIEVLEGDWTPKRLVILEFPSIEQAEAWIDSPEYAAPRKMRQKASRSNIVVVEGVPPA